MWGVVEEDKILSTTKCVGSVVDVKYMDESSPAKILAIDHK